MEKWFLLNELIIVIYYGWFHLRLGTVKLSTILISLLVFISLKLVFYIFKNQILKKLLLILILAGICFSFFYIDESVILLLPSNILLMAYIFKVGIFNISTLMFVAIPFINENLTAEYAIVILYSCLLYIIINKATTKIDKLNSENDSLRKKNHYLQNSLDKDLSYENEIKELSQLEERNKIAQQIHDNIGHTITGSVMQLEAANALINQDTEKSSTLVNSAIRVLRQGVEQIQQTLKDIKPSSEQLGLHSLKVILSETQRANDLKINLFYDENIDVITYIQWKVILKNIKEAITNSLKYSKASKINIRFEVLNKLIKVEVKDNGVGALQVEKGLGIIGMEERTQNLNGQVIVDGSHKGFSVITILPI